MDALRAELLAHLDRHGRAELSGRGGRLTLTRQGEYGEHLAITHHEARGGVRRDDHDHAGQALDPTQRTPPDRYAAARRWLDGWIGRVREPAAGAETARRAPTP